MIARIIDFIVVVDDVNFFELVLQIRVVDLVSLRTF